MRNRLISVAAASAAALILASCGGADDGDGGTGGTAAGGLKGSGTGDSCVIGSAVPVGAALSLTGAAASYGTSQQKGLQLALEELGKKPGVKYDLKIEDDQTDPKQGITVFEGFVNNNASIIIGPTLSNTAFQAQPIAQEGKTPVLAVSNTATGITAQGDYIFRDSLTEAQVIPQTVKKAKSSYNVAKVIVMYSNDDAFTESGYKVFDQSLKAEGIQVLDTLTFSKADTDFRALLAKAKAANPDAIVVSGLIEAAIPLVTQAREVGITKPIIGGNGFNNPKLMKDAGQAAEGVVVGAAWNSASDNPLNKAFLTAFEAKFSAAPDQFAAQAYTGLMLIDQAVRAGCSGERDAIKAGLAGLKNVPTVLGDLSINAQRDAEHPAVVQVVKGGKFTVVE
jgi:branched-chain amino acid transport system substrate-binding protein